MSNWCAAQERRRIRAIPNGPDGHSWIGTFPVEKWAPIPARGMCVVYVLYDESGHPVYVGSTEDLGTRLQRHRYDGKVFAAWMAYRCTNREKAYKLEAKMLAAHRPPLNGPRPQTEARKIAAMNRRQALREAHQLAADALRAMVRNEYDPSLSDADQERVNAALETLARRHTKAAEREANPR